MSLGLLLGVYCLLILVASLVGGWVPLILRLSHRRMQVALSFVSGVMFGVALLHLLPHAIMLQVAADSAVHAIDAGHDHHHDHAGGALGHGPVETVMYWLMAGFLVMFLAERFLCFHHHETPEAEAGDAGHEDHDKHCAHGGHRDPAHAPHHLRWSGATAGLTLHTLIAGIALAASVQSEWGAGRVLAGFGTFLVIVLHKPFDAMTITTLMGAGRQHPRRQHLVNGLFSLAIPLGVGLFFAGMAGASAPDQFVAAALAFSAGTFLCIALSDVLPELQFHSHDRIVLSLALGLGLGLAVIIAYVEAHV